MFTAKSLVENSITLYSLPDVYFQIREMIHDPRYSAIDIGKVIAKDPSLSMRLLKIVNSSFYSFQSRIDTVSRAVAIVGVDDLYDLVLATSVVDTFDNIPGDLVNMTDFWIESVSCALIAKLLAKKSIVLHCERLFLAGLLHNIGALVLYGKLPDKTREILQEGYKDKRLLVERERVVLGFTRADVGAELAALWGLPDSLVEAIRCQMSPQESIAHTLDAHLLYLAVNLCDLTLLNSSVDAVLQNAPANILSLLHLTGDQISQALQLAVEEFNATFDLLAPGKQFH